MSGIYIRMKMPIKGYRLLLIHADGTVQSADGETTAVSVPDHGRLIDADVLRSKCDDPHWCVWMSEIDDSPTIIPANKEESTNE